MAICPECGRPGKHHPNCPHEGESLGFDDLDIDDVLSEVAPNDEYDGDGRGYIDRY